MKSIFKRYCLTHTYLSKYVKTSNKDKYKRGAKNCSGKWISERSHPLVPDAMPYGIGKGGWPEQCCSRCESRTDIPACHAMGQKIPVRRYRRSEEQTREWTQTHHQHPKGQGGCKGSHTPASPERFQSQSRLGESDRKKDKGRSRGH